MWWKDASGDQSGPDHVGPAVFTNTKLVQKDEEDRIMAIQSQSRPPHGTPFIHKRDEASSFVPVQLIVNDSEVT